MRNIMKGRSPWIAGLAMAATLISEARAQQPIQATVDEVLLDLIVRDKKGKPVTDLKPGDITVLDNGAKQTLTGFRLVSGSEAIAAGGARTTLDPLRQFRLVTLAFEAMTEPSQRKLARAAALDLVDGAQGTNVFYSVVVINTQLIVLQQFTNDKEKLDKAIERATEGLGGPGMVSESDAIQAELKRNLSGQNGAVQDSDLLSTASDAASQPVANGAQALQAKLAAIMLDMLRMDSSAASQGARLTLSALRSLVEGQRQMPGRKSVVYFTWGMYLSPELDALFRGLVSTANRSNVTFYSVDTRGVMVGAQTAAARAQLAGAARASATTITSTSSAVTKDEIMSSDNAETSARTDVQEAVRHLAESTGGFLIGDSNDLRVPLRYVNEEIASYYEVSYNPHIQNYDGSFRKVSVTAGRKDLVIHSREGYFALPPGARASGLQAFEVPLLQIISNGKTSEEVKYRAGGILLRPAPQSTAAMVLVEVPLHELQPAADTAKKTLSVHCSLLALVKDEGGTVVDKLARDRNFVVTKEQLAGGNFVDKLTLSLAAGKYTLESVVMDRNSGKAGMQRSELEVPAGSGGVGISSLTVLRSYTPNAKPADADDPFQFQGGSITPTLDPAIKIEPNAMLRMFFTVYQDPSIAAKPAVEIEFLQDGKSLTKVPMQLPPADAQGRIPYVMTIPAGGIPPGTYEVRATARQGNSSAQAKTTMRLQQ
jgi:VWFA-related protein